MHSLPGASEGGPGGGVEVEDVGRLTKLLHGRPGGTVGAAHDDGPCPWNCCWGII